MNPHKSLYIEKYCKTFKSDFTFSATTRSVLYLHLQKGIHGSKHPAQTSKENINPFRAMKELNKEKRTLLNITSIAVSHWFTGCPHYIVSANVPHWH